MLQRWCRTGLAWERLADDGSIHDMDNGHFCTAEILKLGVDLVRTTTSRGALPSVRWCVHPLAVILLAACANGIGTDPARTRAGGGTPAAPADLRGTITARTPDTIRVEAAPTDQTGSPKVVVRLMPETEVRTHGGRALSAAALQVGQVVGVWLRGPALESYPVQGQGRLVLLEDVSGSADP